MKSLQSSVAPEGRFVAGIHRPSYRVANLRQSRPVTSLGRGPDGQSVTNHQNFPSGDVDVPTAGAIFEIVNPLPFRGVTYIGKDWADAVASQSPSIQLPPRPPVSMSRWLRQQLNGADAGSREIANALADLPEPILLALATTSTDPEDLVALAEMAGSFIHEAQSGRPTGLGYLQDGAAGVRPDIRNHHLFEAVANNPYLPDDYKTVMVLRPGAQGGSEITAEWGRSGESSHVYEYLRRNSYIPWGHFAANMAEDAIRYRAESLTRKDLSGLRHLYYQRTYWRLGRMLALVNRHDETFLKPERLEALRRRIQAAIEDPESYSALPLNATLWGWNFGFDYAPSRYRLHASHQQTHQQYALIPRAIDCHQSENDGRRRQLPAYACGDLVDGFIKDYRAKHGVAFFEAYLKAVRQNERLDGRRDREASLVVHADRHVMLFVPKAQTSQWELQLVTLAPVGNILEADQDVRQALDRAIWVAIRTLGAMGARMVTTIEYAKRFDAGATGQHLLYSFLPRLPESPGAFSEAQLRWIVGHYPEDFAADCRSQGFACG
ncbi:MAG: hypothetical protein PVF55_07615 [Desulfobacterales bacterium]|jgi:hypothetical protein